MIQPEKTGASSQVPQDEALLGRIREQLHCSGYAWLRRVQCTVRNGCVSLRGRVPSYYLKQYAQFLALSVDGVKLLRNDLVVVPNASGNWAFPSHVERG